MTNVDGNIPQDSGSILTSQNLLQQQEGKVDPGDLIRAVLADKSAFDMLKSAIKADSQNAQITKADQGPSTQPRATKAQQPLDPEISIIDSNPPKKPRWDVSNTGTPGSDDRSIDHEDALDTEPLASHDSTSAARWAASEELSSFLELVARKPLTNFERKTMCREYPRPNVDAVYTPELDDNIAALVQGAKAIDKDNRFLQDKVLDITGPLCMLFEHLTPMRDSSSKDLTLSQDQVQSLLQAVSYSIRLVGNASSLISATRRSAVLNKINNRGSLASLGKEDYPNAGRKLFGAGFEARLKARAETAQTLMDASSAGRGRSQNRFLYRGTSRPFRGSPYRGRGANRAFRNRGTGRFQPRGQPTNFRGRGQQWTPQAPTV